MRRAADAVCLGRFRAMSGLPVVKEAAQDGDEA